MPKSKKPKNDLRGVKKVTAVAYVAAAVIFLVLPAAGAALFRYSFLRLSAVIFSPFSPCGSSSKSAGRGEKTKSSAPLWAGSCSKPW